MKTSKAREHILGRIRKGLSNGRLSIPFPEVEKDSIGSYFEASSLSNEELYATEFIKLGGKFMFCDTEQDFHEDLLTLCDNMGWKEVFCSDVRLLEGLRNPNFDFIKPLDPSNATADACITDCELLVARTGSTLITSNQQYGRIAPVYYPVHIIVAYMSQVVYDLPEALAFLHKKYGMQLPSMINLNTGPSRTADIEKTLVVGVHGPGEVYCFLINK